MTRTRIQFPDRQDWSLSEVIRRAAEPFVARLPAETVTTMV